MQHPNNLAHFLHTSPLVSRAHSVHKMIFEGVDIFAKGLPSKVSRELQDVDSFVENSQKAVSRLNTDGSWPDYFLPIRGFRESPMSKHPTSSSLRFLSSGTTSGSEGRSKSNFSADGEILYRSASLRAFSEMLCIYSHGHSNIFAGVSLVPKPSDWPDSSLAKMISWISEVWKLEYANSEDPKDVFLAIQKASQSGTKPVFVFGTAFHFINLLDQGTKFQLAKDSIVIETGGTKGKSRSVERQELYELIGQGFGCKPSNIVSEYGMCELASQAYDFVKPGESSILQDRRFRFPNWAPVRVMTHYEKAKEQGIGVLTLWDLARIDIPVPIQTEDMAEVYEDGSFKLLGRVTNAPLKGCSLNVDELISKTQKFVPQRLVSRGMPLGNISRMPRVEIDSTLVANCKKSLSWLKSLSNDAEFAKKLSLELGSSSIGNSAISDFRMGIPVTDEIFALTVISSIEGLDELPKEWLVIAPSTHSLAPLHILCVSFALGLTVDVRCPDIMGAPAESSALYYCLEKAKELQLVRNILDNRFKINAAHQEQRSLIVFGSDQTVSELSKLTTGQIIGFGNLLSGTITTSDDFDSIEEMALLVKDNISLVQRGCMSARINLVVGSLQTPHRTKIESLISKSLEDIKYNSKRVLDFRSASIAIETTRLKQLGAEVFVDEGGRFLIAYFSEDQISPKCLSQLELAFVFVQVSKSSSQLTSVLNQFAGLNRLSISYAAKNFVCANQTMFKIPKSIEPVMLGKLNVPKLEELNLSGAVFAHSSEIKLK